MNTKLTLTLEKEIIDIAKVYAKERGQSLSEMVENYFKLLTVNQKSLNVSKLSPKVKELRGILTIEGDINYQDVLTEELSKKYGV